MQSISHVAADENRLRMFTRVNGGNLFLIQARATTEIASFTHPGSDETVRDGENQRADENPDETERDEAADHACEDEQ